MFDVFLERPCVSGHSGDDFSGHAESLARPHAQRSFVESGAAVDPEGSGDVGPAFDVAGGADRDVEDIGGSLGLFEGDLPPKDFFLDFAQGGLGAQSERFQHRALE
jgi:hypothetical protein